MRTQKQLVLVKDCDERHTIIPGIPDDVALLCLARLPSRTQAQTCRVSLCWKRAIESQVLFSLRLQLRTLETQFLLCFDNPALGLQDTFSWWVIDPLSTRYFPVSLPFLPLHDPVRAFPTASPREVLFLSRNGDKLTRVDLFRRRSLHPSAPLMRTNRRQFASASLNGHVYAAGGHIANAHRVERNQWQRVMLNRPIPLKSVERLDCTCMSSWESLPDMHVGRAHSAAAVMNGQLYVIGGKSGRNRVYSGEIWESDKQEWSLVPELWPYHIFHDCSPKGRVAVVMDHLLAIKERTHEVMVFEQSTRKWTLLGLLPFDMLGVEVEHPYLSFSCMLFGLAKELWVVVQRHCLRDEGWMINCPDFAIDQTCILSCMPFADGPQPLTWRRQPYCFDGSFLLSSVVQVTI